MTVVWKKPMKENINLFKAGNRFTDQEENVYEFLHFSYCQWKSECLGCCGKITYIDTETGKTDNQCFCVHSDGPNYKTVLLIKEIYDNYFEDDEFLV